MHNLRVDVRFLRSALRLASHHDRLQPTHHVHLGKSGTTHVRQVVFADLHRPLLCQLYAAFLQWLWLGSQGAKLL